MEITTKHERSVLAALLIGRHLSIQSVCVLLQASPTKGHIRDTASLWCKALVEKGYARWHRPTPRDIPVLAKTVKTQERINALRAGDSIPTAPSAKGCTAKEAPPELKQKVMDAVEAMEVTPKGFSVVALYKALRLNQEEMRSVYPDLHQEVKRRAKHSRVLNYADREAMVRDRVEKTLEELRLRGLPFSLTKFRVACQISPATLSSYPALHRQVLIASRDSGFVRQRRGIAQKEQRCGGAA